MLVASLKCPQMLFRNLQMEYNCCLSFSELTEVFKSSGSRQILQIQIPATAKTEFKFGWMLLILPPFFVATAVGSLNSNIEIYPKDITVICITLTWPFHNISESERFYSFNTVVEVNQHLDQGKSLCHTRLKVCASLANPELLRNNLQASVYITCFQQTTTTILTEQNSPLRLLWG